MKKKWYSSSNVTKVIVGDNKDWGPSVTQPDESLSVREILYRVSQGLTTGIPDGPDPEFDDDNDEDFQDPTLDPEFDTLDALSLATSEEADLIREREETRKKRQRKKKQEDAFNAEVERRLKAKEAEGSGEQPIS